jgi:hypothetical protein
VSRRAKAGPISTRRSFGARSPETLAAIDDEAKATALRCACFEYGSKPRDLEGKFSTALSTLRQQYLAQVWTFTLRRSERGLQAEET